MNKVLCIDSCAENPDWLGNALKQAFHDLVFRIVIPVHEGLALASSELPDMIILNVAETRPSCKEICISIKENVLLKRCSLVIITAAPIATSDRAELIKQGVDLLLTRPVNIEEFIPLISILFRLKKAEDYFWRDTNFTGGSHVENTSLIRQPQELQHTENELKDSYAELEQTKRATLNLMEDLREEVAQRKRSQEVLLESEKQFKDLSLLFRSISDNMVDMLWAKDLGQNTYLPINPFAISFS